ncbi:hypothetical protein FSW04_06120 [Baekduia soli]|uniref:Uncharacterized protein n=1 Tax=Baekduia soli TaxID=496014 RepID=A0A5B8U2L7_9ACTN|nr:hypothetical protein [Baekduia soli]QEC47208.1 hypothetical protein FSW04_06120 [Baekduia soli]
MDDDRRADHTDDPRDQDTGQGGYPEAQPGGATPDEGEGGTGSTGGGAAGSEAPSPATDEESERQRSTGNPGAAG